MAHRRLALCLSLAFLLVFGRPCFAQRADIPSNLCHGLANGLTGVCFQEKYQKANEERKSLISKIIATIPYDEKIKLNEAQKAWEIYRDLSCSVDGIVYFGNGTGNNVEQVECLYVETRLQIKDLHKIYDWEMRPH
jgi:uncharacterized protein YecT (DUF1311 family)